MKVKFINESQESGNNKSAFNRFIFRNEDTWGELIIGETTTVTYYVGRGNKQTKDFPGVIWPAKLCKFSEADAKRIFQDYLNVVRDNIAYNTIRLLKEDGVYQTVVLPLWEGIRKAFPEKEVEYV